MKKLIFLFLLIPIIASGQITSKILPSLKPPSERIALAAYEAESEAIFAAMGTTPNDARKTLIDNLVKGLKDDGVWTLLDFFYLLAAHAENSSLLNWINPGTFDATNVSSTAFEVDRGYTGDGTADYLNSNYNPNTDGINYVLDDASFGVYVRTNVSEDAIDIGARDKTPPQALISLITRANTWGVETWTRVNELSAMTVASTDSRGFYISTRTGTNQRDCYKNETNIISDNQVSVKLVDKEIYILCRNENGVPGYYSTKQIAAAFTGSGMTQTNVDNFTDRIETFMDAINAGVISEMMWLILLLIPNIRRKEEEFKIAA